MTRGRGGGARTVDERRGGGVELSERRHFGVLRGSYPDGVLQHFYNLALTCDVWLLDVSNYCPLATPLAGARAPALAGVAAAGPEYRTVTIHSRYRLNRQHPGTLDAANRHTPVEFTPQTNFDAQIACQLGPSGGMAGRRGPTDSDPQTDEPLIP